MFFSSSFILVGPLCKLYNFSRNTCVFLEFVLTCNLTCIILTCLGVMPRKWTVRSQWCLISLKKIQKFASLNRLSCRLPLSFYVVSNRKRKKKDMNEFHCHGSRLAVQYGARAAGLRHRAPICLNGRGGISFIPSIIPRYNSTVPLPSHHTHAILKTHDVHPDPNGLESRHRCKSRVSWAEPEGCNYEILIGFRALGGTAKLLAHPRV